MRRSSVGEIWSFSNCQAADAQVIRRTCVSIQQIWDARAFDTIHEQFNAFVAVPNAHADLASGI
jgi:hypothetical protein